MTSRERVQRAIHFHDPDRPPIRNMALPAALYEHGDRLRQLWKRLPGDFGDPSTSPIPQPDPRDRRLDGTYFRTEIDEWGVEWEFVQFGIAGHPTKRPLDDWQNLRAYKAPRSPLLSGPDFEKACADAQQHKRNGYLISGWINIFEILHSVRNFEDVLMDLMDDSPEINQLADLITDYQVQMIRYYIATGADGVMLADDWGSQSALLLSPAVWRRFFRPRYLRLIEPMKQAGVDVFFHSCGHILPLLDDLIELNIDVLWPQLGCNDNAQLAQKCRERHVCVELHLDRQRLLPLGTPSEIHAAVAQARRTFGDAHGGYFFHGEIDNGFPFANVEALLTAFR
ncbi:MAG TPA: uroporphyrinogen decarboxylase family protein [Planctomycetota bacterium]|jgi:hypothetical protein